MERSVFIDYLANRVVQIQQLHPVRVAIDRPDAAGKTTLAQELAVALHARGRPVIRASIDGFHNPARIRHRRGNSSPEGYYHDSFDYKALTESLLAPLGLGGSREYRSAVFDYRMDSAADTPTRLAEFNAVLLFDGVFLLRSELIEYWDFAIFVDAEFEIILARAEQRDAMLFGGIEEVRSRYEQRYIPGQKLYYAESRPRARADIVVDHNDPKNPKVTKELQCLTTV